MTCSWVSSQSSSSTFLFFMLICGFLPNSFLKLSSVLFLNPTGWEWMEKLAHCHISVMKNVGYPILTIPLATSVLLSPASSQKEKVINTWSSLLVNCPLACPVSSEHHLSSPSVTIFCFPFYWKSIYFIQYILLVGFLPFSPCSSLSNPLLSGSTTFLSFIRKQTAF